MLEMMRQNAMEMFRHQNQPYKVEELQSCSDNIVQIWKIGTFMMFVRRHMEQIPV